MVKSAWILWGVIAWLGCQDGGDPREDPETARWGEDTGPPGDSDPGPPVDEYAVGDQEADDSWIFSTRTIHQIDITLSEESIDGLEADAYTYQPGSVTFDGEAVDDVGVRLRGKFGSFRSLSGKPKFKIDFNQYVEDQRFWGLETLSLNNEVVDHSYLKEPLAYALMAEAGVPAPRTGFAQVTVNGEDYGLYVLIETPDDRFLKRTQERPDGNLYDGKYLWDGCCSLQLLDVGRGLDEYFPLEEGVDIGHSDIERLSTTLLTNWGWERWDVELAETLDWDLVLKEFAVEQWVGQNDGYVLNTNNYRLYFDPGTGKASIVPWDFDYSFLYDSEWGMDWWSPRGTLAYGCRVDDSCSEAWTEAMVEVLAGAESADLVGLFDDMQALIAEAAEADPRKETSWSGVQDEQAEVRAWLERRSDELRTEYGL